MRGVVVRDWTASFPEGVVFRAGDRVQLEKFDPDWPGWVWSVSPCGPGAWAPLSMIESESDLGGPLPVAGRFLEDYESTELTAPAGERLTLFRETSGWYWAEDGAGRRGWIPARCVDPDV
ncbi:MAG: hypothetical protein FJY82_03955 [Candidatus Aminicenantes bacterium]|nr:hypothetical protein [Candidatus Aminicenantes bacterium]